MKYTYYLFFIGSFICVNRLDATKDQENIKILKEDAIALLRNLKKRKINKNAFNREEAATILYSLHKSNNSVLGRPNFHFSWERAVYENKSVILTELKMFVSRLPQQRKHCLERYKKEQSEKN